MANREIKIDDPELLFKRWFRDPFEVLEVGGKLESGDGAIAALMMVLPLYERYLDAMILAGVAKTRATIISDGMELFDEDKAKIFWNVFRDGFCHSGMPFEDSESSRREGWVLPKIGFGASYPDKPVFAKTKDGSDVICLNPWGFAKFVLDKYSADPALLTSHPDAPLLTISLIVSEKVQIPVTAHETI